MKIVTSPILPETVVRRWSERLFSRPWRPWQKNRAFFIITGDEKMIVCHPNVAALIEQSLATPPADRPGTDEEPG